MSYQFMLRTARLSGMLIAAAVLPLALIAPALAAPNSKLSYSNVLPVEAKSKAACEAIANRIFVDTKWGSECIAYFATAGYEKQRGGVLFFDGDMALETYADATKSAQSLDGLKKGLQRWSDELKVRYIYVSRVGLNGSSGNHGDRRKPREVMILNAATDILKQRLGLDTVVLAGQSGGSTIAASMLSLGRKDVTCAVLGSGALELVEIRYAELKASGTKVTKAKLFETMFDPASNIDTIAADPKRRIFIVGDEADTRTPFAQQQRYAESLTAYGHRAKLISVDASGDLNHGVTPYTIPTAGGCLKGTSDEQLVTANGKISARRAAAELASASPATSGAAALMRTSLSSGR